jgi:Pyruvate/2-oxoacid:ferredoxin oxidoreductase delta subunit
MMAKSLRKIIQIDEEKCDGCGLCVTSCAEGALAVIGGKARLIKEKYCDGLAACLKECPRGALTIVERQAQAFDKEETEKQTNKIKEVPYASPGSAARQIEESAVETERENYIDQKPMLGHWPVQLALVPAGAKFLDQADVVIIADCVPFAYPNLHRDFLRGHAVLVACPKLDDFDEHLAKLKAVLTKSVVKSVTVVRMEVPCCSGLTYLAKKAIEASGRQIPFKEITIGIKGRIIGNTTHKILPADR